MNHNEAMGIATKVPGMMWPRELTWLFNHFQQSELHAEIGSYCGRSLFMTAAGMVKDQSKIIAIDPSNSHGISGKWLSGVLDLTIKLCPSNVEVERWKTTSDDASLKAYNRDLKFDSVFIDGDHRLDQVSADIESWLPLMKPGGIIAGHDYWTGHQGVMVAVNNVLEDFNIVPNTRIWWKRVGDS